MKEYCLGDLIDIKHGYAFDGEHISPDDNGVVLVTPGNFKIGGGFQEEKCKFFSGEIPEEFVLHSGDYIVTMTDLSKTIDTLGFSAIVPYSNRTYLHNQRIGLITFISDECDRDYIYYLMQTHSYQRAIANTSTGSTVHHTSPSKIREYRFHAPEKSMQIRAAHFLKNIDSLIENNQKQIKLLEEEARRLYKEWFIDLRFPGHESIPIHDGIPDGWEVCTLNGVAKVNASSLPKNYAFDYLDYIDLSAVSAGRIEESTRYSVTEAPGRAKRIAHDGDVIWGMVRPNLKSYALILHPSDSDVFSTGFAILSAETVPFTYLYCAVTQPSFVSYLVNCTNGAAYPAVRPEHFEKATIIKPIDKILLRFHEISEPLFRKTEALWNQNKRLMEARDRLLPKLMSGEIEV